MAVRRKYFRDRRAPSPRDGAKTGSRIVTGFAKDATIAISVRSVSLRCGAFMSQKVSVEMNKSVLIGALVLVLAGGGYYQFVHLPEKARIAAEEAAQKAEEEAAAAAKKAEEEAAAAAKAAEEAAAKAAEEAAAAAAAATEAATDAAATATAAATDAAAAVTEAATGAAAAAGDALAALDPATFDAAKITALIDGSSLDDATKTTLKTAVTAAASNPSLVADTVAQVKAALGM